MLETNLRTHTCGELDAKSAGKKVKLCGWVHTRRDHGGLIFIDIRDFYGMTQVVFKPEHKALFEKADGLRKEFVVQVEGEVKARPKGMENKDITTGSVEVVASGLNLINKALPSPFPIEDRNESSDEVRLKYRFLDLRRPVMKRNLVFRHNVARAAREYMSKNGFVEIETPLLVRATPEGARDYIVPSRVNPGMFYALPQSPQLYKQILMISGIDRYFQMARCLRDEDLRMDRQPEHTQMDLEVSFASEEDVRRIVEGLYKHIFKEILGVRLPDFPQLSYAESMSRFGTDKPDLRFGLELVDVTELVAKSDFNVFKDVAKSGGKVKAIFVDHNEFSKKDLKDFEDLVKDAGAKGLAMVRLEGGKFLDSHIAKFFSDELAQKVAAAGKLKKGYIFMVADKEKAACTAIGKLRGELGRRLGLIKQGEYKFCWVVDFPLFSYNNEERKWDAEHHIFSMPKDEHIPLLEKDPGKVLGKLYDVVLNGTELGSGSIRISQPDLQERVMAVIGMKKEEARKKFGFLLDAYDYGGPIHGGMGLGLDRLVALMLGGDDIREVIAFPKNKSAQCPMDGSPSEVDPKQLKEANILVDAAAIAKLNRAASAANPLKKSEKK
jgi:aspartyl-tRNA synthetase